MADDEYLKRDLEYMLDGWRDMQAEILRLRAENEKLRAALKPFAKRSEELHSGYDDGIAARDYPTVFVLVQDLRAAAAALKETGDE